MATSELYRSSDLLPTPTVTDCRGKMKSTQHRPGSKHSIAQRDAVGLLPTPTTGDRRSAKSKQQGINNVISTCSPAAFPASPSLMPASDEARAMTASSGRKCSELLKSSSPLGLLVKTLLASQAWHSQRVKLTWKTKAILESRTTTNYEQTAFFGGSSATSKISVMKFSRLLFQLAPSTLRTEEIGSGLLPTPQAIDRGKARPPRLKKDCKRDPKQPGSWRGDLKDHLAMLPTPAMRDYKGANSETHLAKDRGHHDQLPNALAMAGESRGLKLQPAFALWMMGFPEDWCDFPMEEKSVEANGDRKHSRPPGMRLSRQLRK